MRQLPQYKLLLLSNGNTAFFKNGEQVPEVQRRSWFLLQVEELQRQGIDARQVEVTLMGVRVFPFVTEDGRWSWSIRPMPENNPMPPLP